MTDHRLRLLAATLLLSGGARLASAHSASDAYLDLTVEEATVSRVVIHGQWDVALRDLDFVLKLDDNGDGEVTWGELKSHQAAIERYAFDHLSFSDGSHRPCHLKPVKQWVDGHADGTYAALFFDVTCERTTRPIAVHYSMFFAVDPSHRGILVAHSGTDISTAILAPDKQVIELAP